MTDQNVIPFPDPNYQLPAPTRAEELEELAHRWLAMPDEVRRFTLTLDSLSRLIHLRAPEPLVADQKAILVRRIEVLRDYLDQLEGECR